jgi:hypothetical protein
MSFLNRLPWIGIAVAVIAASGCNLIPSVPGSATSAPNTLNYDAPVSLVVKLNSTLPGTPIKYAGKSASGSAQVLISNQLAPKQVGDTLDWQGVPVPNVNVKLNTRVASFDDQSITLVGTARVDIADVAIKPSGTPPTNAMMEFNAPVTYSISKNEFVPGSNIAYGGSTSDGAKFLGVDGYAYRKTLDSLQYFGRLNSKVSLKLDLRVLSFSDAGVVLGGTANIKIDAP